MNIAKVLKSLNSGKVLCISKDSYQDSMYLISDFHLEHIYAKRISRIPQPMEVLSHICKRRGWYRDANIRISSKT